MDFGEGEAVGGAAAGRGAAAELVNADGEITQDDIYALTLQFLFKSFYIKWFYAGDALHTTQYVVRLSAGKAE